MWSYHKEVKKLCSSLRIHKMPFAENSDDTINYTWLCFTVQNCDNGMHLDGCILCDAGCFYYLIVWPCFLSTCILRKCAPIESSNRKKSQASDLWHIWGFSRTCCLTGLTDTFKGRSIFLTLLTENCLLSMHPYLFHT